MLASRTNKARFIGQATKKVCVPLPSVYVMEIYRSTHVYLLCHLYIYVYIMKFSTLKEKKQWNCRCLDVEAVVPCPT